MTESPKTQRDEDRTDSDEGQGDEDFIDRAIDWFFGTRALAIWTLVFGCFFIAELSFHGSRHPVALLGSLIPFTLFSILLVHDLDVLTASSRRETWDNFFKVLNATRLSLPLLLGWVTVLVVELAVRSTRAAPAFYETVAQVIPVVALVMAVEGRLYAAARQRRPFRPAVTVMWGFLAMAVGETVALYAIAVQRSNQYSLPLVSGALVAGFASILFLALLGPMEIPASQSDA
jgi:hypothetical protein